MRDRLVHHGLNKLRACREDALIHLRMLCPQMCIPGGSLQDVRGIRDNSDLIYMHQWLRLKICLKKISSPLSLSFSRES